MKFGTNGPKRERTGMTKKEVATVCFQILGRHFPGESGNDTPELRQALKVDDTLSGNPNKNGMSPEVATWKSAATTWLVDNISFKADKKTKVVRTPANA